MSVSDVRFEGATATGTDSHRENKQKAERSQEDCVGGNLYWILRMFEEGASRRGREVGITINRKRLGVGGTRSGRKTRTVVEGLALDERQIPNSYAAENSVADDEKTWKM